MTGVQTTYCFCIFEHFITNSSIDEELQYGINPLFLYNRKCCFLVASLPREMKTEELVHNFSLIAKGATVGLC